MVQEEGGSLYFTDMDGDMIRAYFGRRHKVESTEMLKNIAPEGMRLKSGREKTWRVSWRTGITRMLGSTGRGAQESVNGRGH